LAISDDKLRPIVSDLAWRPRANSRAVLSGVADTIDKLVARLLKTP